MSTSKPFSVSSLPSFEKELSKILAKYPAFLQEFEKFKEEIKKNPEQGSHLGAGIYKVRLDIPGKPSGKSYGARVIQAIFSVSSEVLLIRIYDKSDTKDLTKAEEYAYRKMVNEIRKQKKRK
jgi:hypothetical protein